MRRLVAPLLAAAALAACSSPGSDAPAIPLPDGPVGIEGVVQHLIEAPDYPAGLGEVTPELAELRAPELRDRHHVFLVDAPAGARLDGALVSGAVVRVPDGATLTSDVAVSTAPLDGAVVAERSADCAAPCEVAGPALVALEGFLPGIAVDQGWELVVPAPTE